ncbi:MAG TPA: UDP-N-acetylmuramate:L-alanyl-gamma-D-glutamyl-meso-diaminopimelate ligase [Burkholderiales bacterium]|nr:UDP-N-acetylmuramate:L-alanyl-gamma-D-glutamyl-meso-diaminopimelate ligase [Burkholderiales bacterium]
MHIHILGICGTFMGGIAALAQAAGHRVTGCDTNVYPPMSTQLERLGIEIHGGFSADQIALNPDLWVVGNVVSRGNPLMEAVLERGDRYVSGPQWLADEVLFGKWVLGVAGTHGKTTTSSMLAWILEYAGLKPGFLIGGVPQNFDISARHSSGAFFVLEADEYDSAFFDKRSKFVHYRPRTAILNNLEFDHADIFPDLGAIETQFHHLVRTIPASGRIIANSQESLDRVLERGCWSELERFGDRTGWSVGAIEGNSFEVCLGGTVLGDLRWELQGEHNRQNALASIAAARHAGVEVSTSIAALERFKNVKRRMELRGDIGGVMVYDDFAHHPTAIEMTIAGLRQHGGKNRIIAVLEPRSNTMKQGVMKAALPESLRDADRVFCYTHNLGWNVAEALAPLGAKLSCVEDLGQLVEAIAGEAKAGDQVLIMSNGGFGGIHDKLLSRLKG